MSRVDEYIVIYRRYFRSEDMSILRLKLERMGDEEWLRLGEEVKLYDPYKIFIVSFFAGPVGIDRFMIRDNILGFIKTITFGGLMIWAIIDTFLIYKIAQKRNLEKILHIV